MEGAVVRGDYLDPNLGRTLFRIVAEEWYETTVQRTPKTRAGYRHILDHHLLPTFGGQPVGRIDAAAIDRFTSGLTVAPATARNILRVLSPVLKYAVKARMIVRNPVEDAAKPKVPRPNTDDVAFLTAAQVAELADAVEPRSRTLVLTAAYTGLRSGELVALRVRNVDLLNARLRVEGSVTDVGGILHPGMPKNGRTRIVALPAFLVKLLEEQMAGRGPDHYVFGTSTPHRHANWYRRTFRPAVERLVNDGTWPEDLRRLRFRDLRHTCAALLIANGEHPKAVQDRLGHSSITVTMDRYGKLYPGAESALADRLDATYVGTVAKDVKTGSP